MHFEAIFGWCRQSLTWNESAKPKFHEVLPLKEKLLDWWQFFKKKKKIKQITHEVGEKKVSIDLIRK